MAVQIRGINSPQNGADVTPGGGIYTQAERGTRTHFGPVTIDTSGTSVIRAANAARKELVVVNNSGVTIYLGKDNTVTTTNGTPWLTGTSLEDRYGTEAWYGIVASGTATVTGWETA